MTTIAYKAGVLAADRQETVDDTPCECKKIHKVKTSTGTEVLVGCAGNSDDIQLFFDWLVGRRKTPPKINEDGFCAMLIEKHGQIWTCGPRLVWGPINRKEWAVGSGAGYALGAMLAGLSAADSVKIAERLDIHTGCGIDSVTFHTRDPAADVLPDGVPRLPEDYNA